MTAADRRDPPDMTRAETVDKGHGRIETRRIAVRTNLPARIEQNWPGIAAICRLERIRETKDRCSREIIYAITSVMPGKIDAAGLLALAREHWAIENRSFHVRDVTFREDDCRVRSGAAPRALAEIRSAALNLIRRGTEPPRAAREAFAANRWQAIRAVMRA